MNASEKELHYANLSFTKVNTTMTRRNSGTGICYADLSFNKVNRTKNRRNSGTDICYADLSFNTVNTTKNRRNSETDICYAELNLDHSNVILNQQAETAFQNEDIATTHTTKSINTGNRIVPNIHQNHSQSEEIIATGGTPTPLQQPFWKKKKKVKMFLGLVFLIISVGLIASTVTWNQNMSDPDHEIDDDNVIDIHDEDVNSSAEVSNGLKKDVTEKAVTDNFKMEEKKEEKKDVTEKAVMDNFKMEKKKEEKEDVTEKAVMDNFKMEKKKEEKEDVTEKAVMDNFKMKEKKEEKEELNKKGAFSELFNSTYILVKEKERSSCRQMVSVDYHVWCMDFHKLRIYASDLTVSKTLEFKKVSGMKGISVSEKGNIFIAASVGLFQVYDNGDSMLILNGYFRDVTTHHNTVYALYGAKKVEVLIITKEKGVWMQQIKVHLKQGWLERIHAYREGICIYSFYYKAITFYDLDMKMMDSLTLNLTWELLGADNVGNILMKSAGKNKDHKRVILFWVFDKKARKWNKLRLELTWRKEAILRSAVVHFENRQIWLSTKDKVARILGVYNFSTAIQGSA